MDTTFFFIAGYMAVAIVLFLYIHNLQSKIKKLQAELKNLDQKS